MLGKMMFGSVRLGIVVVVSMYLEEFWGLRKKEWFRSKELVLKVK